MNQRILNYLIKLTLENKINTGHQVFSEDEQCRGDE